MDERTRKSKKKWTQKKLWIHLRKALLTAFLIDGPMQGKGRCVADGRSQHFVAPKLVLRIGLPIEGTKDEDRRGPLRLGERIPKEELGEKQGEELPRRHHGRVGERSKNLDDAKDEHLA